MRKHPPHPRARRRRLDLTTTLWFLAGLGGATASAVVAVTGRFDQWHPVAEVMAAAALGGLAVLAFAPWKQILSGSVQRRDIRRLTEHLQERNRKREPLGALLAEAGDNDVAELRRAIHEALSLAAADRLEAQRLRRTMDDSIRRETSRATGRLQREASTDALTHVGNRRALHEQVDGILARVRDDGRPLTALAIDVDLFKRVNDQLGHAAGDECLAFLGRLLAGGLRDDDQAYRIGGDEFLVLMPGATSDVGRRVGERISSLFAQMAWTHTETPRPTLSVGVATLTARDRAPVADDLIRQADEAMYAAKRAGRGRVMTTHELKGAA